MMPESLKQLQDGHIFGEIVDVTSEYNLPIDLNHSFNLAEIMRELTKMSDERVTELKDFSAFAMKIFPLLSYNWQTKFARGYKK